MGSLLASPLKLLEGGDEKKENPGNGGGGGFPMGRISRFGGFPLGYGWRNPFIMQGMAGAKGKGN